MRRVIDGVSEDELLEADFDRWDDQLAPHAAVEAPPVRSDDSYMDNLGPTMIDSTGWPGVSYSLIASGK